MAWPASGGIARRTASAVALLVAVLVAAPSNAVELKPIKVERWKSECKVDGITDEYKCSVIHRAYMENEYDALDSLSVIAGQKNDDGVPYLLIIYVDKYLDEGALRIDKNDPHFTKLCGRSMCVIEGSEALKLFDEMKAGTSMLVRLTGPSTFDELRISLGGFTAAFESLAVSQ